MQPFTTHTGIIATLDRSNVDTDAIIPKQFLKSIKRTGYGPSAFFDWRYNADGSPNPAFELNQHRFYGRSILVTRNNFGCGSSREHAVWALVQDGYRVVVAPWKELGGKRLPAFADIFLNNTTKNGMLAIELSEDEVQIIFNQVAAHPGLQATVDLEKQQFTLRGPDPTTFTFDIESSAKQRLLKGLDDIAITLQYEADITRFEKSYSPY
ncbi:MAG: 3-isopropylmalate dehydratase small subunit [Desulfobacteraceae bacterium]|nr:3-isopropylmalate dehydratase small subunit [Desulfobacteraceae bacterium]